jgi:hypothetical protein
VRACDVTTVGCQSSVFAATACERSQADAPQPPVRVITLDAYNSELQSGTPGPNEAQWSSAAQLLGLFPPGVSVEQAAAGAASGNVVAYYDPDTKGVTIIERGPSAGASSPLDDVFELSHEFVHALQDASIDLQGFRSQWATSTDTSVATRALIEGEADVLGAAVTERAAGGVPSQFRWTMFEDSLWSSILDSVQNDAVPFMTAVLVLPYPLGTAYLDDRWLAGGQPAIDAVYGAPLRSALDYQNDIEVGSTTLVEPLDCYPTTAPSGYTGVDSDALGMAGVLGIYVRAGQSASTAWTRSQSWRGDAMAVFDAPGGGVAVAWRTRWATGADAADFETAISAVTSGTVTVSAQDVTVLSAADPALVPAWAQSMVCGSIDQMPTAAAGSTSPTALLRRHLRRPPKIPH